MNRRLKKLLKKTYGSELPNRKFSFIQQLNNNPIWKKLHPVSSVFRGYPAVKPVLAVFAVMAAATGIIAYNFGRDKNTPPDVPPVIPPVSVTTSTTLTTDIASALTTAETETTACISESTSVKTVSAALTSGTVTAVTAADRPAPPETTENTETAKTVRTDIQTASVITTTESAETTSSAVTSVYYTNLFRHDYTGEEAVNDEALLYGYPDYNLMEDIFRAISESGSWDKLSGGLTTSDFSDAMMNLLLLWDVPDIVEGEITDIEYIDYKGRPWTICEVTLSEVYNSKIDENDPKIMQKNDRIKIAVAGGYMDLSKYIELNPDDEMFKDWTDEQINSTVIYEYGSNQSEIKIGDSYLYFINKSKLDIPAENLYTRQFMCDIAQFTKNGSEYVSCNSNHTDFKISAERLKTLRNHYDLFYDPDSDRCIAFRDESILMYGAFSCYSVSPDGRLASVDSFNTDDGYYPFHDEEYEFSRDENGRPVVIGEDFIMTWTDSGVTIECSHEDFNKTVEINYPET